MKVAPRLKISRLACSLVAEWMLLPCRTGSRHCPALCSGLLPGSPLCGGSLRGSSSCGGILLYSRLSGLVRRIRTGSAVGGVLRLTTPGKSQNAEGKQGKDGSFPTVHSDVLSSNWEKLLVAFARQQRGASVVTKAPVSSSQSTMATRGC